MMNSLKSWSRSFADIQPGEGRQTLLMFLYYLLVLFAYYILKPVSRALFLNKFDADRLPWLFILMALLGGAGASWMSRAATRERLTRVIGKSQLFLIGNVLIIWWLLQYRWAILFYVFAIWVGTFSVITVGQFWLLANNLFDARSARRLFSLIGVAAVLGGVLGGGLTSILVKVIGARNLLLVSGALIALTWLVVRFLGDYEKVQTSRLDAEATCRFRDTLQLVWQSPHLRSISLLVAVMFIVDTLLDYQFSVQAKQTYSDAHLVAFLARFQGIYLNVGSFALQLFFTRPVLRRLGVGGALGFAPIGVIAASAGFLAIPSMFTAALSRGIEASTRYTFTRTGLEMLYLPLPRAIKNRTKVFLEVFVDRAARATAGGLLLLFTTVFAVSLRGITAIVLLFVGAWIAAVVSALRTYVSTLKKAIEIREVRLDDVRINVSDAATIRVLREALHSTNERQIAYVLQLMQQAPQLPLGNVEARLLNHPSAPVRTATFRLLAARRDRTGLEQALRALSETGDENIRAEALHYICQCDQHPDGKLQEFLRDADLDIRRAAVIAAEDHSYATPIAAISNEWIQDLLSRPAAEAQKAHALAARALSLGEFRRATSVEYLRSLLEDKDPQIANAALKAAGKIHDEEAVPLLLRSLAKHSTRAEARNALASYGPRLVETLGAYLDDPQQPENVRENIPRVLGQIGTRQAAEILVRHLPNSRIAMRFKILKSLNRIRHDHPEMEIPGDVIDDQILREARHYYELVLSLQSDKDIGSAGGRLLVRSLEERLDQTLERIFRLLGLRYPPEEIYDAYRAVRSPQSQRRAAALEFLDNTLEQPLKRMVVPVLEETSWERLEPLGRELFGLESVTCEACLQQLIRGEDKWLKAVAVYRAAERELQSLEAEIASAATDPDPLVAETASRALRRLQHVPSTDAMKKAS